MKDPVDAQPVSEVITPETLLHRPVFDPALFGDELRETVDMLNGRVADQLTQLQEDPTYRHRFGYLHLIERMRGPEAEELKAGLHPYYLKERAYDEMLTDESYGRLLVGYAVREACLEDAEFLEGSYGLRPEIALRIMDQFAVFKTFMYNGGFGTDRVGETINGFIAGKGEGKRMPNSANVARAVRGSFAHLPEDRAEEVIDAAAQSYGRMVSLWAPMLDKNANSNRAAGVSAVLRLLREGLAGSGSVSLGQLASGALPPVNLKYRQMMTEALGLYGGQIEWGSVEPYSLYDEERVEDFEDMVSVMSDTLAEDKRVPERITERATIELGALVHATIRAAGTDYGSKLAEQLDGAKQPLRSTSTDVKVLPFTAITQLANKMLEPLRQSPNFAGKTIAPLGPSLLQDLPEAFRRLMFVASHGTEGDDLPAELEVERRMDAVDTCVDVLMAALEYQKSPRSKKAAQAVGALAVSPRGELPSSASPWRKWRPGFGYLT